MINDGLIGALENIRASVGPDFQIIDVSIDPSEHASAAAGKKELYLRRYGRPGADKGWHFLVGDQKSIASACGRSGLSFSIRPPNRTVRASERRCCPDAVGKNLALHLWRNFSAQRAA